MKDICSLRIGNTDNSGLVDELKHQRQLKANGHESNVYLALIRDAIVILNGIPNTGITGTDDKNTYAFISRASQEINKAQTGEAFNVWAEDPDDLPTCRQCNGSGEGMHDGTTCTYCKGSGVEKPSEDERDCL